MNYKYYSKACIVIIVFMTFPFTLSAQRKTDIDWKTVNNISIPVPPAEHPRVFLRARDIDDLKRRIAHPVLKPVWDELQVLAKNNVQIRIEVDAARYLMTRDSKLGKRTLALALETLEKASFDPNIQDVTRPIGRMMVTGAVAYDWCYPLLTQGQKNAFQAQFIRLAKQLECGYPPKMIGWVTGHGSEWMVMRDMLSAGLATYDENPEMYNQAAVVFFSGLLPARNWWYSGHAFHQGTSYSETRFSADLYPLWIFDRLGAGNVYNPAQQFVPYQWIYIRRPDGQLFRAGDGQSKVPKLRSLLSASYYGDGYVLSDYLKNPGIDPMHKLFQLLWSDPDLKPLPVSDLPLTRYMGSPYGWMVARTGWDENSVIAEMKINEYNFTNHQHLDAGAFQIYYGGALAIESGLYAGTTGEYNSEHSRNYYWRTIAHNSLLIFDPQEQFSSGGNYVNDGGQRLPNGRIEPRSLEVLLAPEKGYRTGRVLAQGFGPDIQSPEYSYLKGDITEAYSTKVKEVKRSFIFLNLKNEKVPAALIVFDKVVSSSPSFKKYWLLHSMEEPVINGNEVTITRTNNGNKGKLINTTLLPSVDNAELTSVGGPGKEFWVFGKNYENQPTGKYDEVDYELGTWRVELSPKVSASEDCFLNVMQVMDKSNSQKLDIKRIDGDKVVGVQVLDRIVVFSKSAEIIDRGFSLSIEEQGTYKILLTDLSAGMWQVKKDNKVIIPAIPVKSDEGMLFFVGTKGEYTFLR